MIKVSVMYPNQPGARFDHDYYRGARGCQWERLRGAGRRAEGVVRR